MSESMSEPSLGQQFSQMDIKSETQEGETAFGSGMAPYRLQYKASLDKTKDRVDLRTDWLQFYEAHTKVTSESRLQNAVKADQILKMLERLCELTEDGVKMEKCWAELLDVLAMFEFKLHMVKTRDPYEAAGELMYELLVEINKRIKSSGTSTPLKLCKPLRVLARLRYALSCDDSATFDSWQNFLAKKGNTLPLPAKIYSTKGQREAVHEYRENLLWAKLYESVCEAHCMLKCVYRVVKFAACDLRSILDRYDALIPALYFEGLGEDLGQKKTNKDEIFTIDELACANLKTYFTEIQEQVGKLGKRQEFNFETKDDWRTVHSAITDFPLNAGSMCEGGALGDHLANSVFDAIKCCARKIDNCDAYLRLHFSLGTIFQRFDALMVLDKIEIKERTSYSSGRSGRTRSLSVSKSFSDMIEE